MIGGDVPLNINFKLSKLLLGAGAVLSRIVANDLGYLHRNYYNGISN